VNGLMRVVVAVGLPGSGKSTWLEPYGARVLSSDAVREELTGDARDQSANARVFAMLRARLDERLRSGEELTYIDATNLVRRDRKPFLRMARQAGACVEAVWFDTPLAVCLERNAARERQVPAHVIELMAARLVPPSLEEGFDAVQRIAAMPAAKVSGLVSKLTTE
jgi:predicted kinase